ncbi:type I DNA topoisomerase, partial [Candidatus Dependentiae bacterium]|nr:type I DNA topoisomerase [Candidatus Dependentiae bacterium]
KCGEVFLASDPDREGEIIAWHIGEEIKKVIHDPERIYRITFNEITEPAILEAIQHKSKIDEAKVSAQQARRILDRWVGYEVSPILWKKIAKGLSAGRVQSVALMLICNREDEIINFKPEESWSIHAIFTLEDGSTLQAELAKISKKTPKLGTKDEADEVLAQLAAASYAVAQIVDKKRAKNPLPPFMTSTLQQDAFNKLGFSVEKTMSVAQKLYEGVPLSNKEQPEALITYMRTDSLRIADTAMKAVREFIKDEFGKDYLPKSAHQYSKKGAQDAHEAIRPINVSMSPQKIGHYLKSDEAKLYDLIWKRFVACQMTAAEYFQRQVLIEGGKFTFKATGSTLVFDGFLKVYLEEDEETDKAVKIPKNIAEKMPLALGNPSNKQHFTQPPPRYSEATLVKELEKQGIGRPSTYAATLSTIQKRQYVNKDNKRFSPTELGKAVNTMLTKNLPDIINVTFTAKMEEDLDKIAQNEANRDKVLNEFYTEFKKDLVAFGGNEVTQKAIETDLTCPQCQKPLVVRFGRAGQFAGCSGFPECKFTGNVTKNEDSSFALVETANQTSEELGECPECHKPLSKRVGRFGPFVSCSGYPECKYIHQEALKMPCPSDGGRVTKRRWRGGSFWGCANYPKCKFAIFAGVQETPCPQCKNPYLLVQKAKDNQLKHSCSNQDCGFSQIVESEKE